MANKKKKSFFSPSLRWKGRIWRLSKVIQAYNDVFSIYEVMTTSNHCSRHWASSSNKKKKKAFFLRAEDGAP